MRVLTSETFESRCPHCCGRMKRRLVAAAEKDKEAIEEYYKDLLFDDFYHVWKLNKPLDLSFLSEDEQAEELAICERRAQEEAAEEAAAVQSTVASSSASLPDSALSPRWSGNL